MPIVREQKQAEPHIPRENGDVDEVQEINNLTKLTRRQTKSLHKDCGQDNEKKRDRA